MGGRVTMDPQVTPEEQQVAAGAAAPTILPKIKIRNKRTGEIREIDPLEAQNFGISPTTALERSKAQIELQNIASGVSTKEKTEGQQTKFNLSKSGLSALKSVR